MKFLLAAINAKYIHSNPGVYSLRAFARTKIPGADIETEKTLRTMFLDLAAFRAVRDPRNMAQLQTI